MINQDVIAKTLCVQKDNQQGCNGKCQLKKKLKENNNKTKGEAPAQNSERLVLAINYIQPINKIDLDLFYAENESKKINHLPYKIISKYYDIETPPPVFS